MAKTCINLKCGNEIPSSATYCSFCGTQQVWDGELSEEKKLQKELSNCQKEIERLKKALDLAQKHIETGASPQLAETNKELAKTKEDLIKARISLENLRKQLMNTTAKCDKLQHDLSVTLDEVDLLNSTQQQLEKEIKRLRKRTVGNKNKLLHRFLISFAAVLIIIVVFLFFQNQHNIEDNQSLSKKLVALQNRIDTLSILVDNYRVVRPDSAIFKYSGIIKNNLPNGNGKAQYADGRLYDGNFADGYRQGKGKMAFPDGSAFEGNYVQDKAEGQGTMRYNTGERFEGEWKDDKPYNGKELNANGNPVYLWKNGNREKIKQTPVKENSKFEKILFHFEER